jgi:hypothetical protein
MNAKVPAKSKTSRPDANARPQPRSSGRSKNRESKPHEKGAMREPAQTPNGERSPLREMQDALEEFEKQKGDWSKGG